MGLEYDFGLLFSPVKLALRRHMASVAVFPVFVTHTSCIAVFVATGTVFLWSSVNDHLDHLIFILGSDGLSDHLADLKKYSSPWSLSTIEKRFQLDMTSS